MNLRPTHTAVTRHSQMCTSVRQTTKRPLTAGTLFKNSMIALINNLGSKQPHYVRCIKPNEEKSPVLFDKERVRHQVSGARGEG